MRLSVACVALAAFSLPVSAGEYYHNWSGLYLGGHVGYLDADASVDLSHTTGAIIYSDPFDPSTRDLDSGSSWLGGFQVGANHQRGNLVIGVEADASWTDVEADGRFTTIDTGPCAPNSCTQWDINTSISALGTVRGRLGLAWGQALLYGTGGLAWAMTDTEQKSHHNGPTFPDAGGVVSGDSSHIGYVVGGGLEWALSPRWSIKGEYLYVDLGEADYHLTGTTTPGGTTPWAEGFSQDLTLQTARFGINYKFGGDPEAVPLK
jgi:outer membrane immunogenic protein